LNINKCYFKRLLKFVTSNCYLFQNSSIYKQIKGDPQGNASSSMLASLFLSNYKNFDNINKGTLLYRYIDDIIVFSKTNFEPPDVYPDYLELIKSSNKTNNVNFLVNQLPIFMLKETTTKQLSANFTTLVYIKMSSEIRLLIT